MTDSARDFGAAVKFGTIAEIDDHGRARVRLDDCDGFTTAFLPVSQRSTLLNKSLSMPDIGEHVGVILDQRGEDGMILGAIYSDADAPPVAGNDKFHLTFHDGATIEYDRAAHSFGFVIGGATLVFTSAGLSITVGGATTVIGSAGVVVTGGDVKADSILLKTHKHGNVQSGLSQTGVPV